MSSRRPTGPRECGFLNTRTLDYCLAPARLVVDYSGHKVGSCLREHHVYAIVKDMSDNHNTQITVQPVSWLD